jgi:hypothetical protein
MSDRVAVYIDFDNVVISRYDNVHGDGAWRRDQAREHRRSLTSNDPVDVKLAEGEIDISAIIDYAASFGTVALARAYADWSVPANAAYKTPLVNRSIDLVQLFTTSGLKNGADIRLAVDAVEDLVQHADISHVVFVAGDSDYVPLAQRCKRLGRYVVGIGVAGSTSSALVSACNEFIDYADLPGVAPPRVSTPVKKAANAVVAQAPASKTAGKKAAARKAAVVAESDADAEATSLLVRAVRLALQKSDDEWVYAGGVKSQMQRMNPAFKEKTLNFSTFRAFVESRSPAVESTVDANGQLMVRLP